MADTNLFEIATRKGYRFQFTDGTLAGKYNVEQLWGFSIKQLETLFAQLAEQQAPVAGGRTLSAGPTRRGSSILENKIQIVDHIHATLVNEANAKEQALEDKQHNALIDQMIKERELDAMKQLTPEELLKLKR